jgi:CubicO group peptidase (beta-lactamase class C family)
MHNLLLILLTILSLLPAQAQRPHALPRWQSRAIDSIVRQEMRQQHIIGLSLGVIMQGQVVLTKGYGLANVEQGVPASPQSVYKLGSVSKQMVAAAILLLVQEQKLRLTDTLPQFFPGAPLAWHHITVRQLLNHTSGLPRDSPALDNMKPQPDSVLIRAAYRSPLFFAPGTGWRYCNLGYFMLADIIRQRTGQSFASFMQEQVFKKYNLSHTRTTSFSALVPHRVAGYAYKSGEGVVHATDYLALRPSGAFLSSVEDMLRWELLIQQQQLLCKRNWEQMWRDTVRTDTSAHPPHDYYGYGWDVGKYKQQLVVHHDGTLPGFTSSYFRFPDTNTAIVVLTNVDKAYPRTVALRIAELLFRASPNAK